MEGNLINIGLLVLEKIVMGVMRQSWMHFGGAVASARRPYLSPGRRTRAGLIVWRHLKLMRYYRTLILLAGLAFAFRGLGQTQSENHFAESNDVTWNSLGTDENDSMPLGNGDLALNVWTEQNGDVVLLLAKSDAWSENGQLVKLGRVRVKLAPNPFAGAVSVTQKLKLETGEVEIQGGGSVLRIWVDANHPVVHVEARTERPVQVEAKAELWRSKSYHLDPPAVGRAGFFEWSSNPDGLDFGPDVILPAEENSVSWCHFNSNSIYPLVFEREHLESLLAKYPDPLLHRCFGVIMTGPGLVRRGDRTLETTRAARSFRLDLYALTRQSDAPEIWQRDLKKVIASVEGAKIKAARRAHEQWWTEFWNRSWIHVTGTREADGVSQSYAIQRYMTACAGRGPQPVKFNGSLFTVGHDLPEGVGSSSENHDPDFRAWGASYWNQNTRLLYWPLIATGDNDLLAPWFNMYVQALPLVKDRTQAYYHHDGGAFIETMYFWGLPNVNDFGWNNQGPELQSEWMRYHIQGGLEVLAQMLDRYDYTQDAAFARDTLLPMADGVITYYDQHWKRGADGKILMEPAQAIETYQRTARNPTPDIAGLMSVLPRLLSLPPVLASQAEQSLWERVLGDLPQLPMGTTAKGKLPPRGRGDVEGRPTILPAEKYGGPKNSENPELYTVFPYRLYGVGKANLGLARDTYAARLFPFAKCWGQDGMESAILGEAAEAKKVVVQEFSSYGNQRFRWFWSKNNDWIPDMDNGGAGMMTLQLMLMQCDGKRIQLLPAWPGGWTADFKLCAPYQTTVEGHVEQGKITGLKVVPASRAKDVIVAQPSW
jgi:alpha-L-fucosidase 2